LSWSLRSLSWETLSRHSLSRHPLSRHSLSRLTHILTHNRVEKILQFLFLCVNLFQSCIWISSKPLSSGTYSIINLLFLIFFEFVFKIRLIKCVTYLIDILLQSVSGINFLFLLFIFIFMSFSLFDHCFNFCIRKTTLIIGNCNLLYLPCAFILSRNI